MPSLARWYRSIEVVGSSPCFRSATRTVAWQDRHGSQMVSAFDVRLEKLAEPWVWQIISEEVSEYPIGHGVGDVNGDGRRTSSLARGPHQWCVCLMATLATCSPYSWPAIARILPKCDSPLRTSTEMEWPTSSFRRGRSWHVTQECESNVTTILGAP